ncbi:MAG: hypothetical protein KDC83_00770 [Flavobacteriales bacterium]|nr:hypothetical protein [Flavobacteriales bacterium]
MKNIISAFGLLFLMTLLGSELNAQNNASKTDDLGRIVLNGYVSPSLGIPESARNLLTNRLNQAATKSGMGGSAVNPRFIITANVSVISKDITPTAPPMTALTLEVTVYVGDGIEGTKFSSASLNVKGVGTNESKAYTEALKQLKSTNSQIQRCIMEGKTKIIEYYNSNCDFILKSAQALEAQNEHEKAILTLTSVPEVCKECHEKCLSAIGPVFQKQIDKSCMTYLNEARSIWSANQNREAAEKAAAQLGQIDPQAACFEEASNYANEIAVGIKEVEGKEWEFAMKQQQDEVDTQKATINAAKEVAVKFANEKPAEVKTEEYKTDEWW